LSDDSKAFTKEDDASLDLEPGESEVFTQGGTRSPAARARRASKPAPIISAGFEVLVHEVMAAMTTEPWLTA
jgi:hypothetical protein